MIEIKNHSATSSIWNVNRKKQAMWKLKSRQIIDAIRQVIVGVVRNRKTAGKTEINNKKSTQNKAQWKKTPTLAKKHWKWEVIANPWEWNVKMVKTNIWSITVAKNAEMRCPKAEKKRPNNNETVNWWRESSCPNEIYSRWIVFRWSARFRRPIRCVHSATHSV